MYTPSNQGITNYPQTYYPQFQNNYGYPYQNMQRTNPLAQSTQPTVLPQTTEIPQPPVEGLMGRIVGQVDEIMPSEIKMDGSLGFFPLKDLSAIYVKQWDQNANLQSVRYVPETVSNAQEENKNQDDQMNTLYQILDQLGDIQDLLKQNRPKYNNNKSYKRNQRSSKNTGDK